MDRKQGKPFQKRPGQQKALIGTLSQLETAGLLSLASVQPELEYIFKHPFFQEAAYDSLVKRDRKRLHLQVGEALEDLYADRLPEFAPRLAEHFDQAGEKERALHYYVLAGDTAAQIYANAEAVMHYTRALDILLKESEKTDENHPKLVEIFSKKGRALELMGSYKEAIETYKQMGGLAALMNDRSMELTALMNCAIIHSTPTSLYNPQLGKSLTDRALDLAHELNDEAAEAKIYWNLLQRSFFEGKIKAAQEYGEKSLTLARKLNLKEQLAYTLTDLGNFGYGPIGETQHGLELLEEAVELWKELDNQPMLADSLSTTAFLHFYSGSFIKAFEFANEAHEISKSIGNLWGLAYSASNQLMPLTEFGHVAEAQIAYDETIRLGAEAGFMAVRAISRCRLAYMFLELGAIECGLEYAVQSVENAKNDAKFWITPAYGTLALAQIREGKLAEAEKSLEHSVQSDSGIHDFFLDSIAILGKCELALTKGDTEGTIEIAGNYINGLIGRGTEYNLPMAYACRAKAYLVQGETELAHEDLKEAIRLAEEMNAHLHLWHFMVLLNGVEERLGNVEAARQARERGKQEIQYLLDHIEDQELADILLSQPDARKLLQSG